ncbi:Uncharacterised protein [Mycobacteroides abscessus subsp. abscessus]|nr:Uncharacterised protein [Mycobacteroides abscessus subsp. abscessus]
MSAKRFARVEQLAGNDGVAIILTSNDVVATTGRTSIPVDLVENAARRLATRERQKDYDKFIIWHISDLGTGDRVALVVLALNNAAQCSPSMLTIEDDELPPVDG